MLKIAATSRPFGQNIRAAIRAVGAAGATGIEFDARYQLTADELTETGRRQLSHYLKELGMSLASLHFPLRRAIYEQNKLDARLHAIRSAMQFAGQLGTSLLTIHAGPLPDDESPEKKLLNEILSDLATHGNHVGTTLCLTPLGEDPDRLRSILSGVSTGPLGVNFDPAAYTMAGHHSSDAFRNLHEFIKQIRVRDGVRELSGHGVETEFGHGAVDWTEQIALLEESGLQCWLCADRTMGPQPADDIRRTIRQLKTIGFVN